MPSHNGQDYIGGKTFARIGGATFGTVAAYGGAKSHRIITAGTDAFEASAALGLGSSVTLGLVVVPGTLGTTVNLFGIGNSAGTVNLVPTQANPARAISAMTAFSTPSPLLSWKLRG